MNTGWVRSTRCSSNGCVWVRRSDRGVTVRGGDGTEGPQLHLSADAWRVFIQAIQAGELA